MPRQRRDFDRISGVKEPTLIVVAVEGAVTEQNYFKGIMEKLEEDGTRLKLRVLPPRTQGHSSPKHVLAQLSEYHSTFGMEASDELCLVIDRDNQAWDEDEIAFVARECASKQFLLALSNPCFELWLLLHHVDVSAENEQQKQKILENKKGFLKKEIGRVKGGYKTSKLKLDDFWEYTDLAISRAKVLDVEPQHRWPNAIGTRVYLIVEKIRETFHQKI